MARGDGQLAVGAVLSKFVAFSLALVFVPLAVFYALHSSGLNLLDGVIKPGTTFRTDVISAVAAIVALNLVIVVYVLSALGEAGPAPTLREEKDE